MSQRRRSVVSQGWVSLAVGASDCSQLSSGRVKGEPLTEKAASHIFTICYCIVPARCNCFNCVFNCEGSLGIKSTLLQVPVLTYWEILGPRLTFHRSQQLSSPLFAEAHFRCSPFTISLLKRCVQFYECPTHSIK